MKLVRQRVLHYREGSSDKVYEVDLCEIGPDRYLVNFRYGRRGSNLKEGTKTVGAVSKAEAERVFNELIDSKLRKGYVDFTGVTPASMPKAAVPQVSDPRKQAILNRLAGQNRAGGGLINRIIRRRHSQWPLERVIWRAGELKIREAAPLLVGLIGTAGWMRDYCVAWALGWCGDDSVIEPLARLFNSPQTPEAVRRIACEALLKLSDAQTRRQFQQEMCAKLPQVLSEVVKSGSAEEFNETLKSYLNDASAQEYEVLETIYLIDSPVVRPALIEVCQTAPLKENWFQRLRRIFKIAEYRRDAEIFGLLAHRFETCRANSRSVFTKKTQQYLKRRIWRTLRKLGDEADIDYVKMAVGVLLPFKDSDGAQPSGYYYYGYRDFNYSNYWSFCNILFKKSSKYEQSGYIWRVSSRSSGVNKREEAYPELWNALPRGLLHLISASQCSVVHEFAVRALKDNREFCERLDVDALKMMLESQYDVTAAFGFEMARSRYRADSPQPELVLALAYSKLEEVRRQAYAWIESGQRHFIQNVDFLVALAAAPHADTRQFARRLLMLSLLSEGAQRSLIGKLIATLLILQESEKVRDLAQTIYTCFAPQLRNVGMGVLLDLAQHPMFEVQELAGQLLINHDLPVDLIDEEILKAFINSQFEAIRAYGVRVFKKMSEAQLLKKQHLLASMIFHKEESLRTAALPLILSSLEHNREFRALFTEVCIEMLLLPETEAGLHRSIASMLSEPLAVCLDEISLEAVKKLVRARSLFARDLGGILIQRRSAEWAREFTTEELVRLGRNEAKELRTASGKLFEQLSDRFHRSTNPEGIDHEMAVLEKVLDNRWEDAREYWFEVFRTFFRTEDFTPAVLVSICDSVRKDVQALGRELITRNFRTEHGTEYLLKLSEHPEAELQSFASSYLEDYAQDHPERILSLRHYFTTILAKVNRGRVAKLRVLKFLEREALKNQQVAEMVVEILARQSVTIAISDKAAAIETMVRISKVYPKLNLPLSFKSLEVRNAI